MPRPWVTMTIYIAMTLAFCIELTYVLSVEPEGPGHGSVLAS